MNMPMSRPHIIIEKRINKHVSNRRSFDNRLKRIRSLQRSDFFSSKAGVDEDDDERDSAWSVIYTGFMTKEHKYKLFFLLLKSIT